MLAVHRRLGDVDSGTLASELASASEVVLADLVGLVGGFLLLVRWLLVAAATAVVFGVLRFVVGAACLLAVLVKVFGAAAAVSTFAAAD